MDASFDVAIVGGGPGGLSAALVLGRARRRVLLCDSGRYRNSVSHAMHGYLTRDGVDPAEFRRLGRAEVERYGSVERRDAEVTEVAREGGGFVLGLRGGEVVRARKLILATGVVDELPRVEGAEALYGTLLFHCPYCDGWEHRDRPLAIYGRGDDKGAGFALEMTLWSRDLVLCTDGPDELSPAFQERLRRFGIAVRVEPIERFAPHAGGVQITFAGGGALGAAAIFFNTHRHQPNDFARRLGCEEFSTEGCRIDSKAGKTHVPGLYVVGDASRDVLQVVVAAGEGLEAAISINKELLHDDGVL